MQSIKVVVNIEIDGQQLSGYPIVKQLNVDELQSFNYEIATASGFVAVPLTQVGNVQFIVFRPDKAVVVRLDGQTDAGIELAAHGLLLVMGATIDAATPVAVDNESGDTAVVKGFGAGT